jgi:hypothetical protein
MQVNSISKSLAILAIVAVVVFVFNMVFDLTGTRATKNQIAKIHETKLTLGDVMGDNLPSDPGSQANTTIAGVDVNKNGIRDDVELAIFKAYPKSAKTRMPLLQYALALQLEMTLPVLNPETFTEVVADSKSRADVCMWILSSRDDLDKFGADMEKYRGFVEKLQINNTQRDQYQYNLYENNLRSYTSSNEGCDLELSSLPN